MKIFLVLSGLIMTTLANGQEVHLPKPSDLSPGTMRVVGDVLSAEMQSASVVVIEVIGTSQGIVNPVAQGDTIAIRTPEKPLNSVLQKIIIDIREKQSVDASKTEFVLLRWREHDRKQ